MDEKDGKKENTFDTIPSSFAGLPELPDQSGAVCH